MMITSTMHEELLITNPEQLQTIVISILSKKKNQSKLEAMDATYSSRKNASFSNNFAYVTSQPSLGLNHIEEEGCKYLAQGQWEKLERLDLSIHQWIKAITKSRAMGAGIFPRENGEPSNQSNLVRLS